MRALGLDIGGSSVKAALLVDGEVHSTAQSERYEAPDRATLERSLERASAAVLSGQSGVDRVGLCAPGLLDRERLLVARAVNVPGIEGVHLGGLTEQTFARIGAECTWGNARPLVATDARATAHDLVVTERVRGRVLCLALGTGVGAAVLDDGEPLRVSGETSGHLGHVDVSLDRNAPKAPDGSRGTLEAYIGLRALLRTGAVRVEDGRASFDRSRMADPIAALARALRIAHAVYRPHHIRLAGGVGIRLRGEVESIHALVREGLTSLARDGWTLGCGSHDHHAAVGVARLACDETASGDR